MQAVDEYGPRWTKVGQEPGLGVASARLFLRGLGMKVDGL